MTTTLYRFFDERDRLLYVGITRRGWRRWFDHAGDKSWWPEVSYASVEHFPVRAVAAKAELEAIRTEFPLYNRWGVTSVTSPAIQALHGVPPDPPVTRTPLKGEGYVFYGREDGVTRNRPWPKGAFVSEDVYRRFGFTGEPDCPKCQGMGDVYVEGTFNPCVHRKCACASELREALRPGC